MAQKKQTTKTTKKTTEKTPAEPKPDYKQISNDLIDLNQALVKEIDNLMRSNITAAQIGKILGDIISSFSKETDRVKDTL